MILILYQHFYEFLFGSMIASPNDHHVWSNIGLNLGLMFQIQDDVLEATSSVETMMKSKSDDHNQKATFVSQLGLETAQSEIQRLFVSVQVEVKRLHLAHPFIEQLLMQIYQRKY